jgi:UDP-N-acetylmuramate dehydrogenase
MYVEENKPLAPFTTLGVGGPARWFTEARIEDDVPAAAAWAREKRVPLFVLGGGSNLLVSDVGFDGLVLHIRLAGIQNHEVGDRVVYSAAAGENWESFVQRTVADDHAGLECLVGIPGTVGGTPVQNVGAYGQEVASRIDKVRVYDLQERLFVEFSAAECGFSYRRSRFNTVDPGRYIVTRVDYRLIQGGPPALRYADLQREFAEHPAPNLAEVAEAVRRIRRSKGMLLVEGDPDCRSAGSFFKNPVVSREELQQLARVAGKEPPSFPVGTGVSADCVKIPAAWLIEQAGFAKGFVQGAAGISSRHTLALINRGGAKASAILLLANDIAAAVEMRFSIRLEKEPFLLGFVA